MNATDWRYQPPVSARAPSTRWRQPDDTPGRALIKADVWLTVAAVFLGRGVLDGFADYGRSRCGYTPG